MLTYKTKLIFGYKISKKAQAEMIGLVVIVIMITLGMLFLAKFALQEEPAKKIFTRKGLAYSTMSAVMKTELECIEPFDVDTQELEVQDILLEDCAKYKKPNSGGSSDYPCNGYSNSCDFLEAELTELLSKTLGVWQKDYVFSSIIVDGTTEKELVLVDSGGGGYSSERDSSGLFPIYVSDVGLVESVLYICE